MQSVVVPSIVFCFHTSTIISSYSNIKITGGHRNSNTYLSMSNRPRGPGDKYGAPSQDYPPPFRPSNYGNSYKRPVKEYFDNSGGRFQNGGRDRKRMLDRQSQEIHEESRGVGSTRRASDTKEPHKSSSRQRRFDNIRSANTPPPLPRRRDAVKIDPPLQQYVRPNQQRSSNNNDLLSHEEQQRQQQQQRRRVNPSLVNPMQRNDNDPLVRQKGEGDFYSNSKTRTKTKTTATTNRLNNNDNSRNANKKDDHYNNKRNIEYEPMQDPYKKFDDVQSKRKQTSERNNSIDKNYVGQIESREDIREPRSFENEFLSRQQHQGNMYDDRPDNGYMRGDIREQPPMPPMHEYQHPNERNQRQSSNPYTHYDNIDSPDDDLRRHMDERYADDLESRFDSRYDNDDDRHSFNKPNLIDNEYDRPKGGYVNGFENDFPSSLGTIESKLQDFAHYDSPNPYKRNNICNNDENFTQNPQELQQQQPFTSKSGNDNDETYVRNNIPSKEKDEEYVRNLEARMVEMEGRLNAFLGKPLDHQ